MEVTRAYSEKWKQLDSVVEKYFGKGLSFQEIKSRVDSDCKHGFKGDLIDIDGTAAYSPTKGMYDTSVHERIIAKAIREKIKILVKYKKCSEYWLYIWNFYVLVDEGTISRVNDFYLKMQQPLQFSKIFIHVGEDLYLLQKDKPLKIYKMDQATYDEVRTLALVSAGLPVLIDE